MDNTSSRQNLPGQRLYSEDTYLSPFSVADVRAIYNIAQTNDERQLAAIIGKHINHNVSELATHDFSFCMYWHRINSYPRSPMRVTWKCPHCNFSNSSALESKSLVINNVDEEYEHGIEVPLPSFDEPVKMRIQLVGDDEKARKFLREKKRVFNPDAGQIREGIVSCLLSPEYPKIDEAYDVVTKKLTPDDMFMIQTFEETFAYGVEDYGKFNCSGCGRESRVNFTFNLTQFFPGDIDRRNLRDQILSLKSAKSKSSEPGSDGVRGGVLDGHEAGEEAKRSGREAERARVSAPNGPDRTKPDGFDEASAGQRAGQVTIDPRTAHTPHVPPPPAPQVLERVPHPTVPGAAKLVPEGQKQGAQLEATVRIPISEIMKENFVPSPRNQKL